MSKLQTEVTNFGSLLPTLSCLLNPVLKMRHWEMIQKATGDQSMLTKGKSLTIDSLEQIKVRRCLYRAPVLHRHVLVVRGLGSRITLAFQALGVYIHVDMYGA